MVRRAAWHLATAVSLLVVPWAALAQVHHAIHTRLQPDLHRIEVMDTITLPRVPAGPVEFALHGGLVPEIQDAGARLRRLDSQETEPAAQHRVVPLAHYAVDLPAGARRFTVRYAGEILHPVEGRGEEYARSFSASPGLIGPEGVFLAGSSYWCPHLGEAMVTFTLEADLPADWRSVSQGERTRHTEENHRTQETWTIDKPQEEVYLVAAPFTEYDAPAAAAKAMVFLRKPDAALARKYLDATPRYLEMYSRLIGPYAYSKFALVENFWETGYGMPSFTLLGPTVIRFPFILESSYPHEILHNWWGNGVYVDYAGGNWSEGLTAYLADHLLKEQQGQGVEYRRAALQKYTDYVRGKQDFPLTEFRSRHSAATEAVGYGKALMLFHMLRRKLGDATFVAGLRRFYRDYLFRVASFKDLAAAFSAVAGGSLDTFFDQWVKRTGAPALRVGDARARPEGDGFLLSAVIEQVQAGAPYRLSVPLAVSLEGRNAAYQTRVEVDGRRIPVTLHLEARPVRLDVDPEIDVFRRLDRNEIPPSLGQAFGADKALLVLPAGAPPTLRDAYQALGRSWQGQRPSAIQVRFDDQLTELPGDRAVWLFGWENRFRPLLAKALAGYAFEDEGEAVRIGGQELKRSEEAAVAVARRPMHPDHALAWVAAADPAALPGLGRKLPHYGKYSYLGFTGSEPTNVLKGQWPVLDSPLSVAVTQADGKTVLPTVGRLAPRKPLTEIPPPFSAERMLRDIAYLSAPEMAGRGLGSPELDRAADYIAGEMRSAGLQPGGDRAGDWFQTWIAQVGGLPRPMRLRNVVGVIPGTRPDWAGQTVVVGAHYDHLGRGWPDVHHGDEGKVHPGADDNASGVSVLLELARLLGRDWHPERSVVFVAFTGEEAGKLGSRHYTEHALDYPAGKAIAMLNLDAVGRLGNRELLILGSGSAREWADIFRGAGLVTRVAVKPVDQDIGSGDQTSFLDAGIPAVQLSSGPHPDYHRPTDTVDKIDASGLGKAAAVLKEALEYLAARPEPLSATVGARQAVPEAGRPQGRRVLLGTVPDFGYSGPGVRLSGVTTDSPAEQAGLREGDVVVAINDRTIASLPQFAEVLRSLRPGAQVTVRFLRAGVERSAATRVVAR